MTPLSANKKYFYCGSKTLFLSFIPSPPTMNLVHRISTSNTIENIVNKLWIARIPGDILALPILGGGS